MKYTYLAMALLSTLVLRAQSKLPVIKATSAKVAINDGGYLDKDAWTLSPKTKPDVYTAERTRQAKWVTFYTDIDSIRVKVAPGTRFDFVILLNGKDSCYTQIASAIPPVNKTLAKADTHDTIPFSLTTYSAIHVKALINDKDTLNLHFDAGSFDVRFTREVKKNTGKVNKLQMGTLTWQNPEIVATGATAHEMDGRFGWNLFEGKTVEIDYTKQLLIIHSRLPKALKGYTKAKIDFIRSFPCIQGAFAINGKTYPGTFLLDTGSDQAVILDSAWAGNTGFPRDLPLIRTSVLSDPRGVKYESKVVLTPLFQLQQFALAQVPAYMLGSKNPIGMEMNFLGNDLLKRFNALLDFEHDYLYLKPNQLMDAPYREKASS